MIFSRFYWSKPLSLFSLIVVLSFLACSPKVTKEPTTSPTTTQPSKPKVDENLSPCRKFSDNSKADSIKALESYSLYREAYRMKQYKEAFPLWETTYKLAPAADGKRNVVFADGIRFYQTFLESETDSLKKEAYVKAIDKLYKEVKECYGEDGYTAARMAFDYYYKFPSLASEEKIYALFKESMDIDGEDTRVFVLNPFTDVLIKQFNKGNIELAEAQKYTRLIHKVLAKGLTNKKESVREQFEIVESYAPFRLEEFETTKGFYDCDYYKNKYYSDFEENATDCDIIELTTNRLLWGGCDPSSPEIKALKNAEETQCKEIVHNPAPTCNSMIRSGQYNEAIDCFEEKYNNSTDPEKRAQYAMIIAKIYYAYKKQFSPARTWARKASKNKANWGEPYLLVGKLYASSGPLCGSGRGWNSQIVVWVAIDEWSKAKKVDPSAAKEANKMISKYSQYMPSMADIFSRRLKEGDTYKVPCWIGQNTIIRAK